MYLEEEDLQLSADGKTIHASVDLPSVVITDGYYNVFLVLYCMGSFVLIPPPRPAPALPLPLTPPIVEPGFILQGTVASVTVVQYPEPYSIVEGRTFATQPRACLADAAGNAVAGKRAAAAITRENGRYRDSFISQYEPEDRSLGRRKELARGSFLSDESGADGCVQWQVRDGVFVFFWFVLVFVFVFVVWFGFLLFCFVFVLFLFCLLLFLFCFCFAFVVWFVLLLFLFSFVFVVFCFAFVLLLFLFSFVFVFVLFLLLFCFCFVLVLFCFCCLVFFVFVWFCFCSVFVLFILLLFCFFLFCFPFVFVFVCFCFAFVLFCSSLVWFGLVCFCFCFVLVWFWFRLVWFVWFLFGFVLLYFLAQRCGGCRVAVVRGRIAPVSPSIAPPVSPLHGARFAPSCLDGYYAGTIGVFCRALCRGCCAWTLCGRHVGRYAVAIQHPSGRPK